MSNVFRTLKDIFFDPLDMTHINVFLIFKVPYTTEVVGNIVKEKSSWVGLREWGVKRLKTERNIFEGA